MQIVLEHVTITAIAADRILMTVEEQLLEPDADPVLTGFAHRGDALSHSTSWRAEDGRLILTFAHVLADRSPAPDVTAWTGTPEELEALPSACHAVRHLHFLRFTDAEIAGNEGLDLFWMYAHAVADHHYPAVAGLLFTHGLAGGPDFVI